MIRRLAAAALMVLVETSVVATPATATATAMASQPVPPSIPADVAPAPRSAPVAPATSDLGTNDAALIAHLKKTDYVFSTALDQCSGEKLTRHRDGRTQRFEYRAFCVARAAKESDCPGYDVKAQGTVDSPTWATVRTQTLKLRCSG